MEEKILQYAKAYFSSDVDQVSRIGNWEGYDVYEMSGDNLMFMGIPTYVLAQGEKLRLTDGEESLDLLGGMLGDSTGDF